MLPLLVFGLEHHTADAVKLLPRSISGVLVSPGPVEHGDVVKHLQVLVDLVTHESGSQLVQITSPIHEEVLLSSIRQLL